MPDATLDLLLAKVPAATADIARRTRALILDVAPGVGERVWPGWKAVGYGTGTAMRDYVCMISPSKSWVRLSFMRRDLPDPAGLLAEESSAGHHVRVSSAAELERPELRALLEAAFAAPPRAKPEGPRTRRERAEGENVANASKTIDCGIGRAYHAWTDEAVRRRWLPNEIVIRKATENRSLRITWADGTSVEVLFVAKGESKTTVQVSHSKLFDAAATESAAAFWKEHLAALKAQLEG